MSRLRNAIEKLSLKTINDIVSNHSRDDLAELNRREGDKTPLEILAQRVHESIIDFSNLRMTAEIIELAKIHLETLIQICKKLIHLGSDLSSFNVTGTIVM